MKILQTADVMEWLEVEIVTPIDIDVQTRRPGIRYRW